MIIASSSVPRARRPASGSVRATISSHCAWRVAGASGKAMQGMPSGTPGSCCPQVSSLPTNSSFESLCSST